MKASKQFMYIMTWFRISLTKVLKSKNNDHHYSYDSSFQGIVHKNISQAWDSKVFEMFCRLVKN